MLVLPPLDIYLAQGLGSSRRSRQHKQHPRAFAKLVRGLGYGRCGGGDGGAVGMGRVRIWAESKRKVVGASSLEWPPKGGLGPWDPRRASTRMFVRAVECPRPVHPVLINPVGTVDEGDTFESIHILYKLIAVSAPRPHLWEVLESSPGLFPIRSRFNCH